MRSPARLAAFLLAFLPALALAQEPSFDAVASKRLHEKWGWADSVYGVAGKPGELLLVGGTAQALASRKRALDALRAHGVPALEIESIGTLGGKPAAIVSATLAASFDDSPAHLDRYTATSSPDLARIEKAWLAAPDQKITRFLVEKGGQVLVADAEEAPAAGDGIVPPVSPADRKKLTARIATLQHEADVTVLARELMVEGEDDPDSARQEADFMLAARKELETDGIVGALDLKGSEWKSPHLGSIDPAKLPTSADTYRRGSYGLDREITVHHLAPIEGAGGKPTTPLLLQTSLAIDTDGAGSAHLKDDWGQGETTVSDTAGKFLDPSHTPYFVLPAGFRTKQHPDVKLGDIAAVMYKGKVAYAIFGDEGPPGEVGEGSVALANALGIDSNGDTGGVPSGVTYVIFPGSSFGETPPHDDLVHWQAFNKKIAARGAELLRRAGGTP
jgi:hypothetical protein